MTRGSYGPLTLEGVREAGGLHVACRRCCGCVALAARAQQADHVRRVGVLMNSNPTERVYQSYFAMFVQKVIRSAGVEAREHCAAQRVRYANGYVGPTP